MDGPLKITSFRIEKIGEAYTVFINGEHHHLWMNFGDHLVMYLWGPDGHLISPRDQRHQFVRNIVRLHGDRLP